MRAGNGEFTEQGSFEFQLEWVPDEPSWAFLKGYTSKHNLGSRTTGKAETIYDRKQ